MKYPWYCGTGTRYATVCQIPIPYLYLWVPVTCHHGYSCTYSKPYQEPIWKIRKGQNFLSPLTHRLTEAKFYKLSWFFNNWFSKYKMDQHMTLDTSVCSLSWMHDKNSTFKLFFFWLNYKHVSITCTCSKHYSWHVLSCNEQHSRSQPTSHTQWIGQLPHILGVGQS
jgi:hypothetical protein